MSSVHHREGARGKTQTHAHHILQLPPSDWILCTGRCLSVRLHRGTELSDVEFIICSCKQTINIAVGFHMNPAEGKFYSQGTNTFI